MTTESKIIFFDIDGTLVGLDGNIAPETRQALEKLRQNGHKICIASGRSKEGLPPALDDLVWDGYVLGSGVFGEYQGNVVMHVLLEADDVYRFVTYANDITDMAVMLETNQGTYTTEAGAVVAYQQMKETNYYHNASLEVFLEYFQVVDDLLKIKSVNKIMYFNGEAYIEEMQEKFYQCFDFLPNSVMQQDNWKSGEIMKSGISKAWGIEKVIEYAGYQRKDVIAIGDGYNDIEMIQFAQVGIAMGNGVEELKQEADIITRSQNEDGIGHAMSILNLI